MFICCTFEVNLKSKNCSKIHFVVILFEKTNFNGDYTFGIVLTGGGSKLEGILKTAYEVFNMPIKKGLPINDFALLINFRV